jgi:hypothetical protein
MRISQGYDDSLKVGVTVKWRYAPASKYFRLRNWFFSWREDSDYRIDGLAWVTLRSLTVCGISRYKWTVVPLAEL